MSVDAEARGGDKSEERDDEHERVSSHSPTPPASADGRIRRGQRRKWRGGQPPLVPPFHALFTDVYTKPQFYTKWVRRIHMWLVRARHYKPAAELALDLADAITGDAQPIIEEIPWRDLYQEKGVDTILDRLRVFDEQTVYHVGDLMDQYDQFLRQRGETLLAMIARFEQLEQKCQTAGLDIYKGTARAFRLLRIACMIPEHRRGILVAAGHDWDDANTCCRDAHAVACRSAAVA